MPIPFNQPHLTGKEEEYLRQCMHQHGKLSRDGEFTHRCQGFFQDRYGFRKCMLTTSCTAALEMSALLLELEPGDEVIMPAYTYVSTANAFALRGARIVFADSSRDNPNLDATRIGRLITPRTKAIVPVHYAGVACDMDPIMALARQHNLFVVEDAAQAVDAFYKGKPLGSIGHLGAFSFHDTKNLTCGEGGLLIINDDRFISRAERLCHNGTNRAAFLRGEVDKYTWCDVGSSYLPSEITAAFLLAQVEGLDEIQTRRKELWAAYYAQLRAFGDNPVFSLPCVPEFAAHNAHIFYLVCHSRELRAALGGYLKAQGISAAPHFISLHTSPYYRALHLPGEAPNSDMFTECLLRLPLYHDLSLAEVGEIAGHIKVFCSGL